MTLYHGSNVTVQVPKLIVPFRALDFGMGFYTTTNRDQASDFAKKVVERTQCGKPTLNVYSIDEKVAFPLCDVLSFAEPNDAWLDFVCDNRDGKYDGPRHDFVFGPVANDSVYRTLNLYRMGEIDRSETLARLKIRKLYNQLVFATAKSLQFIRFVRAEEVS